MEFIKADNYLCFAALLEMIIKDQKIYSCDQYTIAEQLGVTLSAENQNIRHNVTLSKNSFKLGITADIKRLNKFFANNNIHLKATIYHVTPYTSLCDDVRLFKNNYTVLLLSYGVLYGKIDMLNVGHAILYIEMVGTCAMRIYDPGPDGCGFKIIDCYRIEEAMYERQGGYLIIRPTN